MAKYGHGECSTCRCIVIIPYPLASGCTGFEGEPRAPARSPLSRGTDRSGPSGFHNDSCDQPTMQTVAQAKVGHHKPGCTPGGDPLVGDIGEGELVLERRPQGEASVGSASGVGAPAQLERAVERRDAREQDANWRVSAALAWLSRAGLGPSPRAQAAVVRRRQ